VRAPPQRSSLQQARGEQLDKTGESLPEWSLKRPEDLISRNHFHNPVLNLLIAAPSFRQPSRIHVGIGGAIQLFPKRAQQRALLGVAECLDVFLDFCERARHGTKRIPESNRAQSTILV
jgi:hypothetical protein